MRRLGNKTLGTMFARHDTVHHGSEEYVRYPDKVMMFPTGKPYPVIHTNTVEGFYSVFKRGMKGVYSIARKSTCTDTWRSLISGIQTGSRPALTILPAPIAPW